MLTSAADEATWMDADANAAGLSAVGWAGRREEGVARRLREGCETGVCFIRLS